MKRFLRNPSAVAGAVLIVMFVLVAVLSESIATHSPTATSLRDALQGPSAEHLLGTDELGRDLFSRLVIGARISLMLGVAAVLAAATIGVPMGVAAGFYGGAVDEVLMRAIDVLLALPGILLAMAIIAISGPGLLQLALAVSVASVPAFARLARGGTLAAKELDYVQASRALGAPNPRILIRHILVNISAPLIVQATLSIGTANLSVASLGFLGLGAQPPTPEWGLMISTGREHLFTSPHLSIVPGVAVMLMVLGFNLLGDGLRDVLDPRI